MITRKIWLIRSIWATIAARILRESRILRAFGAQACQWYCRGAAAGHLQASAYDARVTELPGPDLADQVQRPAQGFQSAGQPLAGRIEPDGVDPGVAPDP